MTEPRANLKDLFRYPILQEGRYGKLRLDKNENTVGFPVEVVREILSGISPDFLAAYPEPYTLYRKIADRHEADLESVVVTPGSEMAIRYLFEAFLTAGDELSSTGLHLRRRSSPSQIRTTRRERFLHSRSSRRF